MRKVFHKIVIGAVLTAITMSPSFAQGPAKTAPTAVDDDSVLRGQYLNAANASYREAFNTDGSIRDQRALQAWAAVYAFIANEIDPSIFRRANPPKTVDPTFVERIRAAQPRSAIAEIVARARTTNIVILNEAHYQPRDRAFALEVARALRPLGYSVLAVETFINGPGKTDTASPVEQIKRDGVVRVSTGFYTLDPVFAGFVRQALALGYEPLAYEAMPAPGSKNGIAEREQGQADNLMKAIFRTNPHTKVLIYVGFNHAYERSTNAKSPVWMAERLKALTGIDPLTIDQTGMSDLNPPMHDAYATAASRIGNRSAVFFERGQPLVLGGAAGRVDLQVVHPKRAYRYGRPTWLATLGGRPVAIPGNLLPAKGTRLIQAFAADAPADAVPLDQVLVTAGKPVPRLMIPKIPYRLATQG